MIDEDGVPVGAAVGGSSDCDLHSTGHGLHTLLDVECRDVQQLLHLRNGIGVGLPSI